MGKIDEYVEKLRQAALLIREAVGDANITFTLNGYAWTGLTTTNKDAKNIYIEVGRVENAHMWPPKKTQPYVEP